MRILKKKSCFIAIYEVCLCLEHKEGFSKSCKKKNAMKSLLIQFSERGEKQLKSGSLEMRAT